MLEEQEESNRGEQGGDSGTPPRKAHPLLHFSRWLLLALPLGLFLWAGELGIDFGRHWDEGHRVIDYSTAARTKTMLPAAYNYPSMTFLVGMFASTSQLTEAYDLDEEEDEYKKTVAAVIQSDSFMLRVRRHFMILSSAVLVWVFAAMLAWGRSNLEALLAAMLLAVSFEVGYHSRWVAPDAIMMQFVAFTIVMLIKAYRKPGESCWLILAATGLGLATSTKYLAGILSLPIILLLIQQRRRFKDYLFLGLLSLLVFFMITPGALIRPMDFIEDITYERDHYRFGHFGFTVTAGLDHLWRMIRYLVVAGPSTDLLISLFFSILGLLGLGALWRESRWLAVVMLCVPVVYVLFISTQRVMFVRNLLVLMPYGAILSARGFGVVWDHCRQPVVRGVFSALVVVAVGVNADAVLTAAEDVDTYTPEGQLAEVYDYLEATPEHRYQLSPVLAQLLKKYEYKTLEHTTKRPDKSAEYLVALQNELLEQGYWPSNDPGLLVRAFGPPSANYDYYSTWPQQVFVVIERERALEIADIFPPAGIRAIFPGRGPKLEPSRPDGQRGSPHSKSKPGRRNQSKATEEKKSQ
jgi:hypothetical protein